MDEWPEPDILLITTHADGSVTRRWIAEPGIPPRASSPDVLVCLLTIYSERSPGFDLTHGPIVVRWEQE